jgi:hypothetical protein
LFLLTALVAVACLQWVRAPLTDLEFTCLAAMIAMLVVGSYWPHDGDPRKVRIAHGIVVFGMLAVILLWFCWCIPQLE